MGQIADAIRDIVLSRVTLGVFVGLSLLNAMFWEFLFGMGWLIPELIPQILSDAYFTFIIYLSWLPGAVILMPLPLESYIGTDQALLISYLVSYIMIAIAVSALVHLAKSRIGRSSRGSTPTQA